MKLIEIANTIDKSKYNEDSINTMELGEEFELNLDWFEQERLKSYWVGNWCCTDTWVGYKIYFLDEEPVAFSIQNARKSDENIQWFSKELALEVRDYLISLMDIKENDLNLKICDINEDIGDSYKIHYNGNVTDWSTATFNKEPVKFIERIRYENDYGIDREVKIRLDDGEEKIVNIEDLDFKYHIIVK